MKKYKKYIFLTAALLFVVWAAKAKKTEAPPKITKRPKMKFTNFQPQIQEKLKIIEDSLINAGAPEDKMKWLLAQVLHETGVFTSKSKVAAANNNFTGIKFLNKSHQKATRGTRAPKSEQKPPENRPGNFYAKFETPTDWARDYLRIITTWGTKPLITAVDMADYVKKLKQNSFFGGSEDVYLRSMQKFFAKLD